MRISRRGSEMAEAALVFPVVALAVIALLDLMLATLVFTADQAALDTRARTEAAQVFSDRSSLWESISFEKKTELYSEKKEEGFSPFGLELGRKAHAKAYGLDEVRYIRWADLIRGAERQSS